MQATLHPVSFKGRLGDALETKTSQLELKRKHLQALANGEVLADKEVRRRTKQIDDLYISSIRNEDEGYRQHDELVANAKVTHKETKTKVKQDYNDGVDGARVALQEADQKTRELIDHLEELAEHADQMGDQAKKNLKEIKRSASPLRSALSKIMGSNISEVEEVDDAVKEAHQAINDASTALNTAMKKVQDLEKKEKKILEQQRKEADDKREESYRERFFGFLKNEQNYDLQIAELREAKAKALSDAKEAYRTQIEKAKKVLQEYMDLAEADRKKQFELMDHLDSMQASVENIKLQVTMTRVHNLPRLAREAIDLGDIGEAANRTIINRVLKTLQHSDWYATIKGKLCALGAAGMFVEYGSTNQQVSMAAGIEMNCDKIVENTNNADVMHNLELLDGEIDRLNLLA